MEVNVLPADWRAIDWRALLQGRVQDHRRGKAAVAEELGVSRSYVSRAMSSGAAQYATVPDDFIKRVIARYHTVADCPAIGTSRPRGDCTRLALATAPTHNPMAMRQWRCCQTCPHKPQGRDK